LLASQQLALTIKVPPAQADLPSTGNALGHGTG
jgi:hypothetical protein